MQCIRLYALYRMHWACPHFTWPRWECSPEKA